MPENQDTNAKLGKSFECHEAETRIYDNWEASGAFRAGNRDGEPYTIVLPPPNVTGSLHMGHALNHTPSSGTENSWRRS